MQEEGRDPLGSPSMGTCALRDWHFGVSGTVLLPRVIY